MTNGHVDSEVLLWRAEFDRKVGALSLRLQLALGGGAGWTTGWTDDGTEASKETNQTIFKPYFTDNSTLNYAGLSFSPVEHETGRLQTSSGSDYVIASLEFDVI